MSRKIQQDDEASLKDINVDLAAQIELAFAPHSHVSTVIHGQRRIAQGSAGRRTALFPSRKNHGSMPLESRLELAYAITLEASPSVAAYRNQAIHIQTSCNEVYIPDFLIKTIDGSYLVHEVKPSKRHLSAIEISKYARVKEELWHRDIGFAIIDAEALPSEKVVQELLCKYAESNRMFYTSRQVDMAHKMLSDAAAVSREKARNMLSAIDLPPQLADYLEFHGYWIASNICEKEECL